MAAFDVIITCSGTGSRLKATSSYLNKALTKLGDKAIISHILESYPEDCRFIITLGHLKEQVRDYLTIAHPDLNIEYVEVDRYEGDGTSLLYSLSKTFHLLDKPFIFNACDSVVENVPYTYEVNSAVASYALIDNQYRSYENSIEDTPGKAGSLIYTGVCYVYDYKQFKQIALVLLDESKGSLSDANVLQVMNPERIIVDKWIDIGNPLALEYSRKQYPSNYDVLPKAGKETYFVNGKVIKFFSEQDTVSQLVSRSKELNFTPEDIYCLGNFVTYSFVPGIPLSQSSNIEDFQKFLTICKDHIWTNLRSDKSREFFDNFYVVKALSRVKSFNELFKSPQQITRINFRDVQDMNYLLNNISDAVKTLCVFTKTHGDLVLDNVIVSDGSYTLIDWREGFDTYHFGDMYYDLAKIKHSLIYDHHSVMEHKFSVLVDKNEVVFNPATPAKNLQWLQFYNQWCRDNNFDLQAIDYIVSLIQISSSGLHLGEDAKLLHYMGWYNLNTLVTNEKS